MRQSSRLILLRVLALLLCGFCSSCYFKSFSTTITQVGGHKITITSTSAGTGGSSSESQTDSNGTEIFRFKAGNCSGSLQNDVLIVNGASYTVPHKTDAIEISDGKVKFNGVAASPDKK